MMGRNAQPTNILLAKGRKHLTKSEIEHREKSKIKVGDNKLKCPDFVKNDVNAYAKFKEILKIYKDNDIVSSSDVGLIGRYCVTFSEYLDLLDKRKKVGTFNTDFDKYEQSLPAEFIEVLNNYMRMNVDLQLDNAINKKMDMLIKMEERLFLTPLAKIKNIPKKEPEKADPLSHRGFGNV